MDQSLYSDMYFLQLFQHCDKVRTLIFKTVKLRLKEDEGLKNVNLVGSTPMHPL